MTAVRITAALLMTALSVMLAACGTGQTVGSSAESAVAGVCDEAPSTQPKQVYVGWVDVTYSTKNTRSTYVNDMVTFATWAADDRALLLMDALTGAPQTTSDFPVRCSFDSEPAGFGGNKALAADYRADQAARLEPELRRLLEKPADKSGSPLLSALAVTANALASVQGATGCIALFSDAGMVSPGLDFREVQSSGQLAKVAAHWKGQLAVLRGSKVLVVGAGKGTSMTVTELAYVERALRTVLSEVDAELVVFDASLVGGNPC